MTTFPSDGLCRRPLVSIVIACFNHGRYLAEAIESALAQTHSPIEVIVVNDGSSDETSDIANRYPVQLLEQVNQGLAAAGNAGIRSSRGEFVMRLDADDRLDSKYVEETLQPMLACPSIHFVYTPVKYFGARNGTYPTEQFDAGLLIERNYIHASALMRRSAFDMVGGYSPDMRGLRCEDWDLWLSFVECGLRGYLVDKPLLEYRQHAGPSMVTIDFGTVAGFRRELKITSRLRTHHPGLFRPSNMVSRLHRLPYRLVRGEITPRFACMLVAFYAVMLVQGACSGIRVALHPRARNY